METFEGENIHGYNQNILGKIFGCLYLTIRATVNDNSCISVVGIKGKWNTLYLPWSSRSRRLLTALPETDSDSD